MFVKPIAHPGRERVGRDRAWIGDDDAVAEHDRSWVE
jgi:hypothetical protein